MSDVLLKVSGVSVSIPTGQGAVHAVDDAAFSINKHEVFSLIGESGSGKSILGQAIMRLLPPNAVFSGKVELGGTEISALSEKEMQKVRGKTVASIAQNPYLAMNPGIRVGTQIAEPMRAHLGISKEDAKTRACRALKYFDIIPSEVREREYPFQYSGGMLQRAMVAMGTAADPELIIADEPTKGVDVLKKRNIAAIFKKVVSKGCAFLLITHDVGFARVMSDRIAVNYCGQIIEIAGKDPFFKEPLHPYSKALLDAVPERGMHPIPGQSPSMIAVPEGCRFHPRCPYKTDRCLTDPPVVELGGRCVRCWMYA
ncbi:Oligopeptide transport system permease protein OppB [Methanosarcina siciliae HI350]|uniref:Nickel import system ATP-binding protein NikD n=1 Tax=Methanosarcina siciliae HI350 TaxID=1434119 RepID=A0A0E3PBJ7_9EURY|nr:ABC transporter ATP-binding protein [Methanosarcina siciliae]AKB31645.1 Oligopeptide transport system permease protein OppB [Methanosarcina siciliae HI350]